MQFRGENVNANLRSIDFNSLEAWNRLWSFYLDVWHHNGIFLTKWYLLKQYFLWLLKRKYVLLFKSLQEEEFMFVAAPNCHSLSILVWFAATLALLTSWEWKKSIKKLTVSFASKHLVLSSGQRSSCSKWWRQNFSEDRLTRRRWWTFIRECT